jgi:hypothetical protein
VTANELLDAAQVGRRLRERFQARLTLAGAQLRMAERRRWR